MPEIYGTNFKHINPNHVRGKDDWYRVPVLMKDDDAEYGIKGFRKAANDKPTVMKPKDIDRATVPFGSGGSMGKYTPTVITLDDRRREIGAFGRSLRYWGLGQGDAGLYTYNTTHKGGQWIQEALLSTGVGAVIRRTEETPEKVLQNIIDYNVNVLITVQQPYQALQNNAKAVGINLHSLIETSLEQPEKYLGVLVPDADGRKQIEFIFLGGFEIVPYAI